MTAERLLAIMPPAWVLAFVLVTINVFVFHFLLGQDRHHALYFFPFGLFGFAAGNLLASLLSSPLPQLGDVHVIEASAVAWTCLTIANGWRAKPG